jgi:hypothetical protein
LFLEQKEQKHTKMNKKERETFWGDKGTKGDNISISFASVKDSLGIQASF